MEDPRLGWNGKAGTPMNLWKKLVAYAAGALVLVVMLMLSAVLFAIAVTAVLIIWARVWWKTREIRKRMREAPGDDPFAAFRQAQTGRVIEGEVVRGPDR